MATLPGAWCYRVHTGTGWPGVSILWLGEMKSLICNFNLGVAARKIVWADLSSRYMNMPWKILKVETKICAIWGILEANLKKSSTLKFIMNISFVPSVCIYRSIILTFIGKKYAFRFFPRNIIFLRFDFNFRENPHFLDKLQALIIIITTITIALKGAIRNFFPISSLCCQLSPTCTLKWPGCNRVQSCATHQAFITCNMSCATGYERTA